VPVPQTGTGKRAYFFLKNLDAAKKHFVIRHLKLDHTSLSPYGIKKKSEIMRNIEKNRKQRPTAYHPISIKLVLTIVLVALGFCVWGTGFIWALAGLYIFLPVIRGILAFFVGLGAIILFVLFLMTFL